MQNDFRNFFPECLEDALLSSSTILISSLLLTFRVRLVSYVSLLLFLRFAYSLFITIALLYTLCVFLRLVLVFIEEPPNKITGFSSPSLSGFGSSIIGKLTIL